VRVEVLKEVKDHKVVQEVQVHQELKVLQVLAQQALLDIKDHKVVVVIQVVLRDQQDPKVIEDHKVIKVQILLGLKDHKVIKVLTILVLKDLEEHKDIRDVQEQVVHQAHQDSMH